MDFLNIPIGLCQYAFQANKIEQVKLYCILKTKCSGKFSLTKDFKRSICKGLGYKSTKTFDKHFHWLVKKSWVTVNSKKSTFHIHSFVTMARKLHFTTSKGAIFEPLDDASFKYFEVFCYAAAFTHWGTFLKRRTEKLSGVINRSPYTRRDSFSLSLPVGYIAKVLKISKSKAFLLKKEAKRLGFLKFRKQLLPIGLPSKEIKYFRKYSSSEPHLIRSFRNQICFQDADLCKSFVILRPKRNLRKNNAKESKEN